MDIACVEDSVVPLHLIIYSLSLSYSLIHMRMHTRTRARTHTHTHSTYSLVPFPEVILLKSEKASNTTQ